MPNAQDFVDKSGGNSDLLRTRADLVAAAKSVLHSQMVTPDYFESFSLKQLRVRRGEGNPGNIVGGLAFHYYYMNLGDQLRSPCSAIIINVFRN
jgi:hypothetical protein